MGQRSNGRRRKGMARDQRDKGKRLKLSANNEVRTYKETKRESPQFEVYYKNQNIVPEEEWDDFIAACRVPLPAAFRITGSKDQAQLVLNLIKDEYFTAIENSEVPAPVEPTKITHNPEKPDTPTLTDSRPDAEIRQEITNSNELSTIADANGFNVKNEDTVSTECVADNTETAVVKTEAAAANMGISAANTEAVVAKTEPVVANTEAGIAMMEAAIVGTEPVGVETETATANMETATANTEVSVANTEVSAANTEMSVANTKAAAANTVVTEKLKPPTCLPWYPDNLAWQLEYSRISLRHNKTLKRLHSFLVSESESGNISRQEAVSMIPPLLMDIKQHHKVLDLCAAPGSKTAQIIEYLHADCPHSMPDGFVIGNDVDNKRCYLMVHQVKRLQSPSFMIINHDATKLPSMNYTNKDTGKVEPLLFDRILADVPCSGDGTLRKNPEVWGNWGTGHAMNLHNVQLKVLERGLELLSVGGRLVYSTCSFNPIENEAVIAYMISKCKGSIELVDCSKELPGLKRVPGQSTWKVMTQKTGDWFKSYDEVPENMQSLVRPSMFPPDSNDDLHINRCMRLCPHHQNTGGFFVAVITKTAQLPWLQQDKKVKEKEQMESTVNKGNGNAEKEDKKKEEPPQKKKYSGYREEPLYYLDEADPSWPSIKSFYGFKESFDHTLFMVRSKEGRKRNIYISSPAMKDLALLNEHKVKIVNTGVKVLARSEHQQCACGFRLVQDGINSINVFMDSTRRINLIQKDVIEMLTTENPFFSRLSNDTQTALRNIGVGGTVFTYHHADSTGVSADLVMTGWRGVTSCRVYVPRFERHHFLRLCGVDPDKVLLDGGEWLEKGKGENLVPNDEVTASDDQTVTKNTETTSEAQVEGMDRKTADEDEEATPESMDCGDEVPETKVTSAENTVTNE